jgi:hypothetical protein
MKKIFLLFLFISIHSFSQEKEYNFYFDHYINIKSKNYGDNRFEESYQFKNTKDSTYLLELKYSNKDTVARIFNHKEIDIIEFDIDFKFKKTEDLSKLKNPILYSSVYRELILRKYKNFHEEMEFENDTINKQILVHLTQYKNKKKKKIINEYFYYFTLNKDIKPLIYSNFKKRLINKYNLEILNDYDLEKTLCLIDGKLSSEFLTQKIEKINYELNFTVIKEIR